MYRNAQDLAATFAIPKSVKADAQLLWDLQDEEFFAVGACHVLAFAFKEQHKDYDVYLIKPYGTRGTHVFVSNDEWCFDFRGYQQHQDFMDVYRKAYRSLVEDWDCDVIRISESFDQFCKKYNHRSVDKFIDDPFKRAHFFICSFNIQS